MEDNTLVKSSFSATINAPMSRWIFPLGALRYASRNTNLAPPLIVPPVQPRRLMVGVCRSSAD